MAQLQIMSVARLTALRQLCKASLPMSSAIRNVKTTPGQKDIASQLPESRINAFEKPILPDLTDEQKKNWICYGWDRSDKDADRAAMHVSFFGFFTLVVVGSGLIIAYGPDYKLKDWAQREAYLELRRREKLGLPLISPDLIDQKYLIIPSEEDLGDTPIII